MKAICSATSATFAAALLCWADASVAAPATAPLDPRLLPQLNRRIFFPPLQNGDFESGSLKPWLREGYGSQGQPATPVQIVSSGYNSGHAVQVKPVTKYKSGYIYQTFSEQPNTNYSVSAMYKVVDSADPGTCTVEMRLHDGYHDDYPVTVSVPMVIGDWTPLTVAYPNWNPPYEGNVDLYLGLECANGTVLFDDVTMIPTGTLEPASCSGSPNVPDGDFEGGSIALWTRPNDPYTSLASPGANDSAHALAFSFPSGTQYASDQIGQKVTGVCFNYYYTIEFDVNWVNYGPVQSTPTENACQFQLSAEFCNQNDLFEVMWPTAPGWVHHSFDCTATRDFILPDFSVGCNDQAPTAAWSIELDNIAINYAGGPAPAPTISSDPTSTPTPTSGAGHKRAEQIAKPRWA